jgi:hypothetical protein
MTTVIRRVCLVLLALFMVCCMYLILTDARAWNMLFALFFVMGASSFYLLLKEESSK